MHIMCHAVFINMNNLDQSTFQGFVISDWEGIDRITSPPGANYTYSVQAGISAGIDMVGFYNFY